MKKEIKRKNDGKTKLVMSEEQGKISYQKPNKSGAMVSEFKKKRIEKTLNEKKQKIKEAEDEKVEQFDNQGFFVLPTNVSQQASFTYLMPPVNLSLSCKSVRKTRTS